MPRSHVCLDGALAHLAVEGGACGGEAGRHCCLSDASEPLAVTPQSCVTVAKVVRPAREFEATHVTVLPYRKEYSTGLSDNSSAHARSQRPVVQSAHQSRSYLGSQTGQSAHSVSTSITLLFGFTNRSKLRTVARQGAPAGQAPLQVLTHCSCQQVSLARQHTGFSAAAALSLLPAAAPWQGSPAGCANTHSPRLFPPAGALDGAEQGGALATDVDELHLGGGHGAASLLHRLLRGPRRHRFARLLCLRNQRNRSIDGGVHEC